MKILVFALIIALTLTTCASEKEAKTLKLQEQSAPQQTSCEAHSEKLQKDVVPLSHGDALFEPEYIEAAGAEFPPAADRFHNAHNAQNYQFAEVLFCAECRRAKERWRQKRQSPAT